MTDRPSYLKVVGEAPEPDADEGMAEKIAIIASRLADVVKVRGIYWILTDVEGDVTVSFYGGKLEASVLAEEIAREKKCEAVGLA